MSIYLQKILTFFQKHLDFTVFRCYTWKAALNGCGVSTQKREMIPAPDSEPVIKERQVQSMHAIIVTGGKQYKVAEGDTLYIEKLNAEAGDTITFDQVLAVLNGDNATFGAPVVEGATVTANVVKNGKGKKVLVFKYKPKKNYRRRQGHRQPYTKVEITKINA